MAFRNVPSYVVARGVTVTTSFGAASVDIAYGGALYACVPADHFGLAVNEDRLGALVQVGREVKRAVEDVGLTSHACDPRLSGLYGTILYDALTDTDSGPHQRNVAIFADGQVDRSPCGSGTSARLALLAEDGLVTSDGGQSLTHESIIGTHFLGRVVDETETAGRQAVVTEVEGNAFRTGEHRFILDPEDPLGTGFTLR